MEGFDDASDDGSEASSISSVGIGNNHLNNRLVEDQDLISVWRKISDCTG